MRYYIDCEFDGHNGPLLSMALVRSRADSVAIIVDGKPKDPWVIENVIPVIHQDAAQTTIFCRPDQVGGAIREFIGADPSPRVVADSPVDIGRFCHAISTAEDGGWASADYPLMTFEVHNVDCYPTTLPGAVQHNAWWDAMALRHKLASVGTHPEGQGGEADLVRSMGDAVPKADAQTTPSENPS